MDISTRVSITAEAISAEEFTNLSESVLIDWQKFSLFFVFYCLMVAIVGPEFVWWDVTSWFRTVIFYCLMMKTGLLMDSVMLRLNNRMQVTALITKATSLALGEK